MRRLMITMTATTLAAVSLAGCQGAGTSTADAVTDTAELLLNGRIDDEASPVEMVGNGQALVPVDGELLGGGTVGFTGTRQD